MKKLVVVSQKEQIARIVQEIDEDTVVVAGDNEICAKLQELGIKSRAAVDYRLYQTSEGVKWMKQLPKIKFGGKTLLSLLEFKGTSLWWWMEYWLYSSYAYCDSFSDILRVFCTYNGIIKKEKPDMVVYVNGYSLEDRSVMLIAEHLGIRTKTISAGIKHMLVRQFKKATMAPRMALISQFFDIRFWRRKSSWNSLAKSYGKKPITEENQVLCIYESNPRVGDYVLPIIRELIARNCKVVSLDVAAIGYVSPWFGVPVFFYPDLFKKKIRDSEVNHILLENYLDDFKELKGACSRFRKLWDSLKKDREFQAIFELDGANIWPLIEPQLSCYFDVRMKNHLTNFIAIDNAVQSLKPAAVITPAETSEFEKGLFLACQERGIPTVAVQHGMMQDLRMMHEPGELSLTAIKPEFCPVPTRTAVSGAAYKRFLLKEGSYPPDSVVVTGNPRYDGLNRAHFDKRKICAELEKGAHKKIDADKKTLVLATQPLSLIEDRILLVEAVAAAMKSMPSVQLIIKVHPAEEVEFYERIVRTALPAAIVTKFVTNEILFMGDAMITVHSAIGLEAAILGKPIIVAGFTREEGASDYVEKGIAIQAKTPADLPRAIKAALFDKVVRRNLARKRLQYVHDHCYKTDGKASARIAGLAKRMMARK